MLGARSAWRPGRRADWTCGQVQGARFGQPVVSRRANAGYNRWVRCVFRRQREPRSRRTARDRERRRGGAMCGIAGELTADRLPDLAAIGFDSAGGYEGDEFRYSDLIAEHFATDHTRFRAAAGSCSAALPDAIAAMSEPMISHEWRSTCSRGRSRARIRSSSPARAPTRCSRATRGIRRSPAPREPERRPTRARSSTGRTRRWRRCSSPSWRWRPTSAQCSSSRTSTARRRLAARPRAALDAQRLQALAAGRAGDVASGTWHLIAHRQRSTATATTRHGPRRRSREPATPTSCTR